MTKAELLEEMRKMGACSPAADYVRAHPSDDAQVIWSECTSHDWMLWYSYRKTPDMVKVWAKKCAERAQKFANMTPVGSLARRYAYTADDSAYASAANAAYAAADAAADAAYACAYAAADAAYAAERAVQLKSLQAWRVR